MKKRDRFIKSVMALRIGIVLMIILFAVISTAIYAYFTAMDQKKNTFSVGSNEITVEEEFENPQPGKKTVKRPCAVNTGKVECYVRGKVLLSDSRASDFFEYYTEASPGMNEKVWEPSEDGWLYYREALQIAEKTPPIFTHIKLKEELPETLKKFSIDVVFESVQKDGFKDAQEAFSAISAE